MFLSKLKKNQLEDKKILVRIDINSAISKGKVEDSPRFRETAETINFLVKSKSKVILLAHQGRKGKKDFLDLSQHAKILSKYTKNAVKYVSFLFEKESMKIINSLNSGEVVLLKNVRSYEDELSPEKKNNKFINFSKMFDLYVNDAFPVSHRAHSSLVIPPRYIKSVLGLNFERELNVLSKFSLDSSKENKTCIILGGQKVEDYLILFDNIPPNRKFLIAGVLANIFLIAKGYDLGFEEKWMKTNGYLKYLPLVKAIERKYSSNIVLPTDFACLVKGKRKEFSLSELPINHKILDIGTNSTNLFKAELKNEKNIFMKGPLGFSELKGFESFTIDILRDIANLTKESKAISLIGGGHLTTTINKYHLDNSFSHISTSGGALIAFLSGKRLPGIEAIKKHMH